LVKESGLKWFADHRVRPGVPSPLSSAFKNLSLLSMLFSRES